MVDRPLYAATVAQERAAIDGRDLRDALAAGRVERADRFADGDPLPPVGTSTPAG